MLGTRNVSLQLSSEAQEWLEGFIAASPLRDPLPGIIYGRWRDESEDHWSIGLYDRSDLPNIDMWLCISPDWEFLAFEHMINSLKEKTIYFQEGKILIE